MRNETEAPRDNGRFPAGSKVQVRCRFDSSWAAGFEVVGSVADAPGTYRIRRRSDGVELPTTFDADALRNEDERSLTSDSWAYASGP